MKLIFLFRSLSAMEDKLAEPHLQCKANDFIHDVKVVHKAVKYIYPHAKIAFRAIPNIHDTTRSINRYVCFNENLQRWCNNNNSTFLYSYLDGNPRFWNSDRYLPSMLGAQNMASILFKQMDLLNTNLKGKQLEDTIHTITSNYANKTMSQSLDKSAPPRKHNIPIGCENSVNCNHHQIIGSSGLNIKWRFPFEPKDEVYILLGDESLKYLVYPCINFPPESYNFCLFTGMVTGAKMTNAVPELRDFNRRFINNPYSRNKIYKDPTAVILQFGIHDILPC